MKRVVILGLDFTQGLLVTYKALVLDDQALEEPSLINRAVTLDLNDSKEDIRNKIIEDGVTFFEVTKHDLILPW